MTRNTIPNTGDHSAKVGFWAVGPTAGQTTPSRSYSDTLTHKCSRRELILVTKQ